MNSQTAQPTATRRAEVFPTAGILFKCLLRTLLVGAGFNTRGMQNVGMTYVMDPGLVAIYGQGEPLRQARLRYAGHYNTHPFWTPLLVGLFLGLEAKISKGLLPVKAMKSICSTTIYTLSAIGDSFFGGSVLVLWSLVMACLVVSGQGMAAIVLGVAMVLSLWCFKALTFWLGFREGIGVLRRLGRWNLINWGQRFKLVNAALLVMFWTLAWPGDLSWALWLPAAGLFGVLGALMLSTGLTREVLAATLVALYLGLPWIKKWLMNLL